MDTKWRRFSRHRGTKLTLFFLFIILVALIVETALAVGIHVNEDFGPEPLICENYENSDVQAIQVQTDLAMILNRIQYTEKMNYEMYQNFISDVGLDDSFESFQFFQRDCYNNDGISESGAIAYLATYQKNGETKTIGNVEKSELAALQKSGLAYHYDGQITCSRDGVPTPEFYYSYSTDELQEIKIDFVYPQDWLTGLQKSWSAERREFIAVAVKLCVYFAVMLFSLIFLLAVTGKKAGKEKTEICWFDRLWTEVTIGLGAAAAVLWGALLITQAEEYQYMRQYYGDAGASTSWLLLSVLCGLGFAACSGAVLAALLSLARKLKTHCFWRTSLIGKLLRWIWKGCRYLGRAVSGLFNGERFKKYRFQRTLFTRQLVFILGEMALWIITAICMGQAMFGYDVGAGLLFASLFGFAALILLAWYANGYAKANEDVGMLCEQIDRIADGNLDSQLVLDSSSLLGNTAGQLNDIRGGMQKNIESQIKSERMKIELITNVSHDLKTPLTSIISYIDLLQKEDLNDEAKDYVNILAQKSDRLKHMVADVFDLAKTTSGEAQVEREKLDIHRLLEQTLADMEDRIERSGRTIRTSFTAGTMMIQGDGKKLYRVFQNLIDNALKYSMDGTRIFVEILREEDDVSVCVKNTASYEMEFTEEEILERFARGDKSRTTEGNGLGLSIAKSFAEVSGGTFRVKIDGDQFKAIVSFPIIEEVQPQEETAETAVKTEEAEQVILDEKQEA